MALQYVGGTSGGISTSASSYTISLDGTLTGGIASSPAQGDLVVVCAAFSSNASLGAPTVSGDVTGAYTDAHTALYVNDTWDTNMCTRYAIMGSTVDATLTCNKLGGTVAFAAAAVVHVWRGVDQTTPMDVTTTTATGVNSSRPDPPSITPTTSGAIVIACGAGSQGTSGSVFSTFGTMGNTVSVKFDGTTSDIGVLIASDTWSSGAYDPPAVTDGTSSNSASWTAATLAIRPAPEPPPPGEGNQGTFFLFF